MTNIKIYDTGFNANEWFVTLGSITAIIVVCTLPARFPRKLTILYFLCGMTFDCMFDSTIGTIPVSFYDVNDSSQLEVSDLISLWMYGGFSYLYFYFYDAFKVKPAFSPLYILCWSLLAMCIEWVGVHLGVYHYDNGYGPTTSFEIYVALLTLWLFFFHRMQHDSRRPQSLIENPNKSVKR